MIMEPEEVQCNTDLSEEQQLHIVLREDSLLSLPKQNSPVNNHFATQDHRPRKPESSSFHNPASSISKPLSNSKSSKETLRSKKQHTVMDLLAQVETDIIITKTEFDQVKEEYDEIEKVQSTCSFKLRKLLFSNFIGKSLFPCFTVKDRTKLPYAELTPIQKKYRIRKLWKTAKLVLLFEKIRLRYILNKKQHIKSNDGDADDFDLLENVQQQES